MPTDNLPCGTDAQCFDPVTDQVVDGSQMCPENDMTVCELQCVYNETDPGFAMGLEQSCLWMDFDHLHQTVFQLSEFMVYWLGTDDDGVWVS